MHIVLIFRIEAILTFRCTIHLPSSGLSCTKFSEHTAVAILMVRLNHEAEDALSTQAAFIYRQERFNAFCLRVFHCHFLQV
jgi:hypothetical protein